MHRQMEFWPDTQLEPESDPTWAATVRCILRDGSGKILLLQKAHDSKNPGKFELPGGKINGARKGRPVSIEAQYETVVREVREETGIDIYELPKSFLGNNWGYGFRTTEDTPYERSVAMFVVDLAAVGPTVTINQTKNTAGQSEDKHTSYAWVTDEEFKRLALSQQLAMNSSFALEVLNK